MVYFGYIGRLLFVLGNGTPPFFKKKKKKKKERLW